MKVFVAAIVIALLAACGPRSEATPPMNIAGADAAASSGAALLAANSASPASASIPFTTAAPLPPGVYAVQKLDIADANGFERPLVAGTILAPAGWSIQGGIVWSPLGACGPDFASNVSLRSPDGASSVRVVPVPSWSGSRANFPIDKSQSQQCPEAFYTTAREFLEASAQRLFPGARVIDYRALPERTKPLEDMMAQMPPLTPVEGYDARLYFEAGEVLVGYSENGREMRAAISTLATISRTRMADMMNPGQVALDQIAGSPSELFIVSAPNGALDLAMRGRIQKSTRFNPEWMGKINAYLAEKNRIAAKGAAERHAIRMDAIKKQGEIINGMYEDRQLTSDRGQREFIEAVRGVETYDDPVYGGPVQLDNTYDHAWRVNGQDAYLMTNDVNFNPGQYGLDARKLEVTR